VAALWAGLTLIEAAPAEASPAEVEADQGVGLEGDDDEVDDDEVDGDIALSREADGGLERQMTAVDEGPFFIRRGLALPYPLDNLFRGFASCRRGRHRHRALDIGGVGPDYGLGTPVRSMTRARVVRIAHPEDDPARRGRRLITDDAVVRAGRELPAWKYVPGYGRVDFFTADYGSSRTGTVIATVGLEGRLEGHTLTYIHLGRVHPSLAVGDVVEAGQEIGVMGGTAVQEAGPHVHLHIANRRGQALDVGPILGIGPTRAACRGRTRAERATRERYTRAARELMAELRRAKAAIEDVPTPILACGEVTLERTFDGRLEAHRVDLDGEGLAPGPWEVTVTRVAGSWQPRLVLEGAFGRPVYDGHAAMAADARRYRLKRLANGRRGKVARLRLQPSAGDDVALRVAAWPDGRRPPRGARYALTVRRPCPDQVNGER